MTRCTPFGMRETTGKFAFQSVAWRRARFAIRHLTLVHRTKEPMLLDALTDRHDRPIDVAIADLIVTSKNKRRIRNKTMNKQNTIDNR